MAESTPHGPRGFLEASAVLSSFVRLPQGPRERNRTLAINRFEALEIPLPSIDEQLHQVKYLDTIANCAISINESLKHYPAAALIAMLPDLVDVALERRSRPLEGW